MKDKWKRFLERLHEPHLKWVRLPLGVLFIAGGVLGFLPVLGFWMVPVGLTLLATDIPLAARLLWAMRRRGRWARRHCGLLASLRTTSKTTG